MNFNLRQKYSLFSSGSLHGSPNTYTDSKIAYDYKMYRNGGKHGIMTIIRIYTKVQSSCQTVSLR